MVCSCLMSSNGPIPLPGGGALLQIYPLEDGVLAVLFLDAKCNLLKLPLSSVAGSVCLPLGGIVGKLEMNLARLPKNLP